jgi:hypothetical protein
MDIRKGLDRGYTVIGNFKNLEFIDHTPEEQEALLLACLDVCPCLLGELMNMTKFGLRFFFLFDSISYV